MLGGERTDDRLQTTDGGGQKAGKKRRNGEWGKRGKGKREGLRTEDGGQMSDIGSQKAEGAPVECAMLFHFVKIQQGREAGRDKGERGGFFLDKSSLRAVFALRYC